ncbi:MAG: sugar kinase [Pseudomonadota bacterium]
MISLAQYRGKIACVGEVMVEVSDALQGGLRFAGDSFNTALYMKRLLPNAHIDYVSALGDDALSDQIIALMKKEGMGIQTTMRIPGALPGLYMIVTDEDGERSFYYWRENSAARQFFHTPTDFSQISLSPYGLVYFSAITLALMGEDVRKLWRDKLQAYRKNGGLVAFDSNYRPALWRKNAAEIITEFWQNCDIALPSANDEMAIYGDKDFACICARLRGWGLEKGAVKRGALGPIDLQMQHDQPYKKVERPIDTTAAGDSFNAGFLAANLAGGSLPDALQHGHELASKVIQHSGAIIPQGQWHFHEGQALR